MTNYFLLIFDIDSEKIVDIKRFGRNLDAANEEYARCESAARERSGIEVVLLGAESLDVIRQTHSNYFDAESSESTTQAFRRVLDSAVLVDGPPARDARHAFRPVTRPRRRPA